MDISWIAVEREMKQAGMAGTLPAEGVYLVGAGFHGQVVSEYLQETEIHVHGFADNSPAKQETGWAGLPVLPLAELKTDAMALITARHAVRQVAGQLAALGMPHLSFDTWFVCRQAERFAHLRNRLLGDEASRRVLDGLLLSMLTGNPNYCKAVMEPNQYFALPDFVNAGLGVYVDVGAYVGDTIERTLWAHNGVFGHIYAFEPGARQMAALKTRMRRLEVEWAFDESAYTCVQAGLGDKRETQNYEYTPGLLQNSRFAPEGEAVAIETLDDFLQGGAVTYIKADIEGMEMAMLRGAENTIRTHAPKLAISLYHRPQDWFTIPEYIHGLVPDYRMALRHHAPNLTDTVLYCWREA